MSCAAPSNQGSSDGSTGSVTLTRCRPPAALRTVAVLSACVLVAVCSFSSQHLQPRSLDGVAVGQQSRAASLQPGSLLTPSNSSSSSSSSQQRGIQSSFISAWLTRQQPFGNPGRLEKLRAAAAQPIQIAVMSDLYWTVDAMALRSCSVEGVPLDCRMVFNTSTAKAFPAQLRIATSMEAAAYYELLDDSRYMCQFDAEWSYRMCAQATSWYSLPLLDYLWKHPPVPFEDKLHALVYMNANCETLSGRAEILQALIARGQEAKVPVHAVGFCDHNTDTAPNVSKLQIFSRYKFCVAMENSISQDYVTEKVWHGLAAGCIPVYLGSPSARHIVPDPNSVIVYDPAGGGDASTPAELDALMHEIGTDRPRYEAMLAWKQRKPEQQPSTLFQHLWRVRDISGECALCQFIARHRVEPQPRYTTCLFNQDWMAAAGQQYVPQEEACPVTPEANGFAPRPWQSRVYPARHSRRMA